MYDSQFVMFGESQDHDDSMVDRMEFDGISVYDPSLRIDDMHLDSFCELSNVPRHSGNWGRLRTLDSWQDLYDLFKKNAVCKIEATKAVSALYVGDKGEADARKMVDNIEDMEAVYNGYGYTAHHTPPEQYQVVQRITEDIPVRILAKYLGWASKQVGRKSKSKSNNGSLVGYKPRELCSSTTTKEMLGVANGDMLTMSRMADESLDSYVRENTSEQGLGNVMILRDESASMGENIDGYTRHQHAVAFEFALAVEVMKRNRKVVTYRWSTGSPIVFDWSKGQGVDLHLISFMEGGSTYIEPSLVQATKDPLPKSDIVVITDGKLGRQSGNVAGMGDFKKRGGKVWIITVGDGGDDEYPWADYHITVESLTDAKDVIKGVINRED